MKRNCTILIVDPNPETRKQFQELLESQGHRIRTALDEGSALESLREGGTDLILAELGIAPEGGVSLLEKVKKDHPETMCIMMTEKASTESVIESLRMGAQDYLIKPIREDELLLIVARAAFRRRMGENRKRAAEQLELERERSSLLFRDLTEKFGLEAVLGHSEVMKPVRELLKEVTQTDSTVLITGESGTGKGVLARIIHFNSPRKEKPFVEANCAIYSEGVLQSELFGHEKGAFTGALKQKLGRFELAKEGTIFLDEIGDLSPGTQLMLLRVLQEKKFERVGGEETLSAEVRVIAATNCNLRERMKRDQFRSDLYYRLNVIPISIPPLRERKEDIAFLSRKILRSCARKLGKPGVEGFAPDAMEVLLNYSWPGNIRELENLIERTLILAKSSIIRRYDLPPLLQEERDPSRQEWPTLLELERSYIRKVLEKCEGNKKKAAALLGINRSSLYSKLKRLDLFLGSGGRGSNDPESSPDEPVNESHPPKHHPSTVEERLSWKV